MRINNQGRIQGWASDWFSTRFFQLLLNKLHRKLGCFYTDLSHKKTAHYFIYFETSRLTVWWIWRSHSSLSHNSGSGLDYHNDDDINNINDDDYTNSKYGDKNNGDSDANKWQHKHNDYVHSSSISIKKDHSDRFRGNIIDPHHYLVTTFKTLWVWKSLSSMPNTIFDISIHYFCTGSHLITIMYFLWLLSMIILQL